MAPLPLEIEIPGAKKAQGIIAGIGCVAGLFSFGAFAAHNGFAGAILIAVTFAAFWIASTIKTTKRLVGGVYR